MKRIFSVIFAVIVGITFSYAQKQVMVYKPFLQAPYMSIEGVFEGKTLADGEVLMQMNNITLEGTYSKGVFSGVMHYYNNGNIIFSVNCDGPVSNTSNGTIAKWRHNWKFDLTTTVVATFKNKYDKTPATGSLEIDTAPIKVESSDFNFGNFVSELESQLLGIMRDVREGRYCGTITFADGFKYEGGLVCDKNSLSLYPLTGAKLIWANGDVFQGKLDNYNYSKYVYEGYAIVPKDGKITTHKGKVYHFDKYTYPSDMFVLAENHLPISPSVWEEKREERLERERQQEEERLRRKQEEERKRQEEWNGYIQNKEETIEQFLSFFVDEKNKTSFTIDDQLSLFELAAIYLIFNTNQGATIKRGFASYSLESTTILNGKMTIGLKNHYDTTVGTTEKEVKRVWFGTCDPKRELKEFTCATIGLPKLYNLEFDLGGEYVSYTLKTPLSSSRIETIEKWSNEFWIEMYGPTLGSAVYYKEVQLGMTIDMIRAIKGSNGELSTRVYSDGEVCQTLEFGSILFGGYERYYFESGKLTHYSITD